MDKILHLQLRTQMQLFTSELFTCSVEASVVFLTAFWSSDINQFDSVF